MPSASTRHLTEQQAAAYARGGLSAAQRASVEAHLAKCAACGELVAGDPTQANAPPAVDESVFHDLRDFHAELSDVPAALVKSEKYRVLKELGRGGMGVVYLAEHRRLERPVVLKVIHPKYVSDEKAIARLHQEAKSAARLHHPNIVATHDVEREGDTHFIVLGYVDGSDLAKLVRKRGPLPVHQACQLVKQAADGLQAAHEEGMVHRDIKPANLMLSRKGIVTILDFGLARLSRGTGGLVSVTGEVIGTPAFMAPEQARNAKSADIRADIYSLGGTLFYLLTGQPPFLKTDIIELMTALAVESPPALEEFRDDVPAGLAELIEKMLAKDREERPATPAELARALTPYTTKRASVLVSQTAALGTVFISQKTERPPKSPSGETPAPPPKAETGRRLWGIVVAAVGAVLVMALVLVLSLKGSGKPDTREKEARLPEMIMSERLPKGINNLPPAKVIEYKPKDALPKPGLPRAFLSASGGKMVFVKGERFWMGSPKEELNRSDDEKQHWVTVSSLYLGETEVTQGQFHRVMNYNPSFFARNAKGKNGVKYESINPGGGAFILRDITDTDELPVENVSWGEAKAFCDRLNELDISCPSGWVYYAGTEIALYN